MPSSLLRSHRFSLAGLGCLAALLPSSLSHGQPVPKFEYSAPDEKDKELKEPTWTLTAQAGAVVTSGNSRTTTVTAGVATMRKTGMNKFSAEGSLAYARSSVLTFVDLNDNMMADNDMELVRVKQTTTEAWSAKLRYDRFLTEKNSLYATAKIASDVPAGKDLTVSGQAGYSRLVFKNAMHELAAEVGYDFSYENYTGDEAESLNIHSGRLFGGYTGTLSADTALTASAELLTNVNSETTPFGEVDAFGDNRFTGKTGLTTKLTKDISFRIAFTALYDSEPAPRPGLAGVTYAPGFISRADSLDTITELQLIIGIL
jgi:putative salt-induced outer membrane protein